MDVLEWGGMGGMVELKSESPMITILFRVVVIPPPPWNGVE